MIAAALAVMTPGYIVISAVAGLIAGMYLVVFHPVARDSLGRWAASVGWYWGSLASFLFAGRVFFLANDPKSTPEDIGRVVGGWLLWLLFAAAIGCGAYLGAVAKRRRAR